MNDEIEGIALSYRTLMSRAFYGAHEEWHKESTMQDFLSSQNDTEQGAANKLGLMEMKQYIGKAIEAMLNKTNPQASAPIIALQAELLGVVDVDALIELIDKVLEATKMLRDDQPNPLYVKPRK